MIRQFSCRPFTLACLAVLGTSFTLLPGGYGQATVTMSPVVTNASVTNGATTSVSGATTANFNEVTPSTYAGGTYTSPTSLNGTLMIANTTAAIAGTPVTYGSFVTGSSSSQYGTPTNDTSPYLSLGGARAGSLTLTFSNAGINYFGLDWASPDSYNSVKLTFADGTTATYNPGTATGGVTVPTATDQFVNFYSTTPSNAITQVVLASTSAAFELDNVAYGVVPEPATWAGGALLVGAAVLGLRRRLLAQPAA